MPKTVLSDLCGVHLLGDPDVGGREMLMALDRPELARLQEFDAAVFARPHLHRIRRRGR